MKNQRVTLIGLFFLLLLTCLDSYAIQYPVYGSSNCPGNWMDAGSGRAGCIAMYRARFGDIIESHNYIFPATEDIINKQHYINYVSYSVSFETHSQSGEYRGGASIHVVECQSGYSWNKITGGCIPDDYYLIPQASYFEQCDLRANPISPVMGDKIQYEVDYSSSSLRFVRTYHSGSVNYQDSMGRGWGHSFSRRFHAVPIRIDYPSGATQVTGVAGASSAYSSPQSACLDGWNDIKASTWGGRFSDASASYLGDDLCQIQRDGMVLAMFRIVSNSSVPLNVTGGASPIRTLRQANGQVYHFNGFGPSLFGGRVSLEEQNEQWLLRNEQDDNEIYDPDTGLLQSITNRQGQTTTLEYHLSSTDGGDDDPTTLDKVTDFYGRSLRFSYYPDDTFLFAEKRIKDLITPDGNIHYDYHFNGNLEKVTYPDGTSKTYHYEDSTLVHHLTGISNENQDRYATWGYDSYGRARFSEHTGGVERYDFSYHDSFSTTVTNAQGMQETFSFDAVSGAPRKANLALNYHDGKQQVSKQKVYTYYAGNGRVKEVTDYQGNKTYYEYNNRGLVTLKTEAKGIPEEYTIITTWHPDYRLPIERKYPDRIETYSYNPSGQLIQKQTTSVE